MQIIDCIALHNFIRGCELGDEEFYKCDDDDDEDYISDIEKDNEVQ
jgi:hypothetical protein